MLSRAELKAMAKDQLKGNIGIMFLCMLLVAVITGVSGFTFIGPIILGPLFVISLTRIYLRLTEGTKPEIKDIFSGVDVIWKSIWLSILIGIFTALWSMLLFIPGLIKALSYSMSMYILADNPGMTAREALNESKRITKGHKMELFVLMISFILWFMLGSITFGIAYIYVVPYLNTTIANYYKTIR